MTLQTANGIYQYNKKYYGKELDEWVQLAHKYNCRRNGWYFNKLKAQCFGYDNLVMTLGRCFDAIDNGTLDINGNDNDMAKLIRDAWVENYTFWRDDLSYNKSIYVQPKKKLGDSRRNTCAETAYDDLSTDEKDKDLIFVTFIKDHIT